MDWGGPRALGAVMDVAVWLRSLGLEQYEAAFRENEISEKGPAKPLGRGLEGNRRRPCWSSPNTPRSYRCATLRRRASAPLSPTQPSHGSPSIASTPRINGETIAARAVGDSRRAACACARTAAARTATRRRTARSAAGRRTRRRTGVAAVRRVLGADLTCRGAGRLGGCRRRRQ